MRSYWSIWVFCLLAVLITVPVHAFDSWPPAGAGGPTDLRAYVRFVNLMPGPVPLDIYLDNTRVLCGISYGSATGYQAIMQKSYALTMYANGPARLIYPMANFPVKFYSQYYYTVVLLGSTDCPRVALLDDDPSTPECGYARLRYLNAAQGVPPSGVIFANGAPLFPITDFGLATEYKNLPEGSGPFTVVPCAASALATIPPLGPCARGYTVIFYGDIARGYPLKTLTLVDAGR